MGEGGSARREALEGLQGLGGLPTKQRPGLGDKLGGRAGLGYPAPDLPAGWAPPPGVGGGEGWMEGASVADVAIPVAPGLKGMRAGLPEGHVAGAPHLRNAPLTLGWGPPSRHI